MNGKNFKNVLPRPKLTLDRLGQITFTLKEVTKLMFKINSKLLVSVFILNAIFGFSAVPGFYIEKLILDRLVENIGNPNLTPVLYSIGLLVFLRLILEVARNIISGFSSLLRRNLSRIFSAELDLLMGKKLAELDLETIESASFRDKFTKIEREAGSRAWGLMMPISDIPNYLVGFISALGVLIFLSPWVSIGIFLVSLPQFFINSRYIRKEYELETKLSHSHRIWGWLSHYLVRNRNIMELKLLDLSGYLGRRMKEISDRVIGEESELRKKREISRLGGSLPLVVLDLGVSIWLIYLVIIRKITVGSFELYLRSLRNAQSNLTGLVSAFLEIYENYIYVTDLVWFLNLRPKIESVDGGINIGASEKISIKFDNVWFKYKKDQPWVVKNANFEILSGERVAIVGENGAGKSTLIKLLARFYDCQKGSVLVNGGDMRKLSLSGWRKKLAVLFQEFETYPFSSKETIGTGDIGRMEDFEGIKYSAYQTGIDKFVETLPLRYENPLAPEFEKGIRPSIGQWQRFGISRILFRKEAKVLILDEPTSNVDPEAEEKIFKTLKKLANDKILIFVTQRFSTVRIADKILVMDKGEIIEQGSHRQLMKLNGKYARLYNLQAQAYINS